MKKLLAILLAAVMLVALFAACNGTSEPTAPPKTLDPGEGVKTAEPTEKKLLAIIVPKAVGSNWFARTEMGGAQWAEDTGNESMMVGSNKADAAVQVQSIQDALALNPDFLSVVPNSPEACEVVLGEAMANGVIVTTQESSTQENCHYDVEAFNNAEYGAHFFQGAMDAIQKDSGKYVYYVGFLTSPTHNQWAEGGIAHQRANYPNWELVTGKQIEAEEKQEVSYAKTKELMQTYPDIELFIGSSGGDPPGTALAIDELGLNDQVFVCGTSMPSQAEKGLFNGSIDFCSFWDPFETQYVCNVVSTMVLNGEAVKDGDDMGRVGYNAIKLDGKVIMGNAWIDVTTENFEKYNFI